MNLLDIRKHFIEFTGRYDLIVDTSTFADAGADWYIQQGQRYLDRAFTMKHSFATNFQELAPGAWFALIPEARAIQEVWMSNSSGWKWQLRKLPPDEIRWARGKDPGQMNLISPLAKPTCYHPVSLRTVPDEFRKTTIDVFFRTMYTDLVRSSYSYDGLIFLPPVAEALELEVRGLFYQRKLVNDRDRNIWTEEHEFPLVLAACRALEATYRNTAGVNDYEADILKWLTPVEYDFIEEESAEVKSIEG